MNVYKENDLPNNWILTTLGEIRIDKPRNITPSNFPDEQFELYSVPSHETNRPEILKGAEIGSNKKVVEPDTVLLCKINPRINRIWIVGNYSPFQKIASTEWIVFEHIDGLEPKYLLYYLQQSSFRDFLAVNVSGVGGSLMRINHSVIEDYPFPLAPIDEQKRIVEFIETQFTRLDATVTGLKRIEANLSRLQTSILKTACEGNLVPTEDELSKVEERSYDSAETLLSQIDFKLREDWETDYLTRLQLTDNQPKNDKWKSKYVAPSVADVSSLPNLPKGWTWALIRQLGKLQLGRQRSPKYRSKDYPTKYIRAANITEQGLDLSDVLEMEFKPEEQERYQLHYGDIVLSEASGSPSQVGKPAIWRDELPICCFQNTVIRVRPIELIPEYLLYTFKHLYYSGVFAKTAGGVGINHLSLDRFSSIPVPLPPLNEQKRIVAEIERRFSVIEKIEKVVQTSLKRAEILRQKILQLAYSGNLVTQHSTDDSASSLLNKIKALRAEKDNSKAKKHTRKVQKADNTVSEKHIIQNELPFHTDDQFFKFSQTDLEAQDMKLIRLQLEDDYKSLDEFDKVFRKIKREEKETSPICLVGLNGSGKSNLIEALSEIFCYLELINLPYESITNRYKKSDLRFELEYSLPIHDSDEQRHIRIVKHESSAPVFLELKDKTENVITERIEQLKALPTRIVGYSSGLNETINIPYFKTKALYSKDVYDRARKKLHYPVEDSRTLFMDYDSNAAILLSNYLFNSEESLELFRNHVRIESIDSFEIVIQLKPTRTKVKLTPELEESIEKLKQCANETNFEEKSQKSTFTYKINTKTLKSFRNTFNNAKDFFKTVHRLSLLNALALEKPERDIYLKEGVKEGLLEPPPTVSKDDKVFSINGLRLKLTSPSKVIDYAGISDGEHQFIHVFGTIKLFDEPGVIFLLDEPETHFNPRWRKEFVEILSQISSTEKQEFIISTHSPFIVSGCYKENVFKFERKGDVAIFKSVDFETYGASFEFLLTELFDLEALISEKALNEMKDLIENGTEKEVKFALNRFGESFEKRFLFEKLEELKEPPK